VTTEVVRALTKRLLPAGGDPYRIGIVCLGNICRSPMAHVVLEAALADAGLFDRVTVVSSGTGSWHVGEPMDSRAAAELSEAGYDASRHRARQFDASWLDLDLVLAMDATNLADIRALAPPGVDPSRVRLFRDFDPEAGPGAEVPDPWHGGRQGFIDVLAMVERTCEHLVSLLLR
jgi:protein-tyrosine phosphatase